MATPTWNQIAAPNFSAGNDLIAQAMNQLTKATTGFKSIADQYKETVQKRNLGLIQEYVNRAKTPEELQSEAFKTGLANLTGSMKGEYDPIAVNQYTDTRGDTLTRRAVDSLNLESGQFDLGQKRLRAPTELDLLQTNALNAKQKLNFDAQNNPLVLAANEVAANVARKTESTQVAQALANLNNTNSTISAREKELKLREQELGIQRLKALADSNKFNFDNSPQGLLNEAGKDIRNFEAGMVADRAKAMGDTTKDAAAWYKERGSIWHGLPKTLKNLVEGKYPSANITGLKDLTPAQLYSVMDATYTKVDTGFNVSDKDFETVKKVFQNEVNTALRGDVDKRNAYVFAQIDNMLNEAYFRNPNIDALKMLKELNIDPKLKEAYFQSKQDEIDAAKAEEVLRKQGSQQTSKAVPSYILPLSSPAMNMQGIVDPSLMLMYEDRLRNR